MLSCCLGFFGKLKIYECINVSVLSLLDVLRISFDFVNILRIRDYQVRDKDLEEFVECEMNVFFVQNWYYVYCF